MQSPYESSNKSEQTIFQVMLMGREGAGKTQFLNQYVEKSFLDTYIPTIGIDFKTKEFTTQKEIKLQMLDTAGQERFKLISLHKFFKKSDALVLFVDPTQSLDTQVSQYVTDIKKLSKDKRLSEDKPLIVVMSKSDMPSQDFQFTQEELKQKLQDERINYQSIFSISAKTGDQFDLVEKQLVALAYKKRQGVTFEKKRIYVNNQSIETINATGHLVMQPSQNHFYYRSVLLEGAFVGLVLGTAAGTAVFFFGFSLSLAALFVTGPSAITVLGAGIAVAVAIAVLGLVVLVVKNELDHRLENRNRIEAAFQKQTMSNDGTEAFVSKFGVFSFAERADDKLLLTTDCGGNDDTIKP